MSVGNGRTGTVTENSSGSDRDWGTEVVERELWF